MHKTRDPAPVLQQAAARAPRHELAPPRLPQICVSPQGTGSAEKVKEAYPAFAKRLRMMRNSRSFPEAAKWVHDFRNSNPDVFNAVWHETIRRQGKQASRKEAGPNGTAGSTLSPQSTLGEFGLDCPVPPQPRAEKGVLQEQSGVQPEWQLKARELQSALEAAAPGSSIISLANYLSVLAGQDDLVGGIARAAIGDFHAAESTRPAMACDAIIKTALSGRESKRIILNEPELRERMTAAIRDGRWLKFHVIWGGFKEGELGVVTNADRQAFETLRKFREKVRSFHSHTSVTIIFCDVHAISFAGTLRERVARYLGKPSERKEESCIASLAASHGMQVVPLSEIYAAHAGKVRPFGEEDIERARRIAESYPDYLGVLQEAAKKHSTLWAGSSTRLNELALGYIARRSYEALLFEMAAPQGVFLSFGDPAREKFLSSLPTIFIYPYGKKSDLPWFTDSYTKS